MDLRMRAYLEDDVFLVDVLHRSHHIFSFTFGKSDRLVAASQYRAVRLQFRHSLQLSGVQRLNVCSRGRLSRIALRSGRRRDNIQGRGTYGGSIGIARAIQHQQHSRGTSAAACSRLILGMFEVSNGCSCCSGVFKYDIRADSRFARGYVASMEPSQLSSAIPPASTHPLGYRCLQVILR
jgi:hypothetical protein